MKPLIGDTVDIVIKVLRFDSESNDLDAMTRRLLREVNAWHRLHSAYVLPFYGLCYGIGFMDVRDVLPGLVSPFCKKGTVMAYMDNMKNADNLPALKLAMATGIAKGLQYLHSTDINIIHGDLKPANVLISEDGRPLLADFGRSKILDVKGFTHSLQANSTAYTAPEILWSGVDDVVNEVDRRSDMYSLGMTMWAIYAGKPPFEGKHPFQIALSVSKYKKGPHMPDHFERGVRDLIQGC
ncbi:kinase-like protein [Neolentinus lepideus HHB14362 ss-1]|uniref:Kinase-like protein n=1 Tax=Neolentinus lepideus HHB14362 ss-1 TaxID=1314782 RepID=A0A165TKZ0_9AGAM|nr:kinase-like protein [Neolentinus lepideus HHB14362 ss-1]